MIPLYIPTSGVNLLVLSRILKSINKNINRCYSSLELKQHTAILVIYNIKNNIHVPVANYAKYRSPYSHEAAQNALVDKILAQHLEQISALVFMGAEVIMRRKKNETKS